MVDGEGQSPNPEPSRFWLAGGKARIEMAERVGFEPTVELPPRRISSAVLSTTQPPLRVFGRRTLVRGRFNTSDGALRQGQNLPVCQRTQYPSAPRGSSGVRKPVWFRSGPGRILLDSRACLTYPANRMRRGASCAVLLWVPVSVPNRAKGFTRQAQNWVGRSVSDWQKDGPL